MRYAGHCRYGARLNGLIVILWRAGLRINEALSLTETDLDQRRGSIPVRHGKNDRRREVGMDAWGWSALAPWPAERAALPVGPLFCVDRRADPWSCVVGGRRQAATAPGRDRGRGTTAIRAPPAPPCSCCRAAARGDRAAADQTAARPFASLHDRTYLQGISAEEIISTVHARRASMMHASAGLAL